MCETGFWKGEVLSLVESNTIYIVNCLKEFLINRTFEILSINIDGRVERRITKVVKSVAILKGRLGRFLLIKLDRGDSLQFFLFDKIILKLLPNGNLEVIESRVPYKYHFLTVS
ncbi:hypothetical protein ACFL2R_03975 [Patescibacteria group bacterium]